MSRTTTEKKLPRIFSIISEPHSYLTDEVRVKIEIMAITATTVPDGLVTSLFVFGALPSFLTTRPNNKNQLQIFELFWIAWKEMETIEEETRIKNIIEKYTSTRYQ